MKIKRTLLFILLLMGFALVGCGGNAENTDANQADAKSEVKKIAILQTAEHGSMDNCRLGFLEGLKEAGFEEGKNLEVSYQNAQSELGLANQQAVQLASEEPDLACGIGTLGAQALVNTCPDAGIPLIYNAVAEPLAVGLAKEDGYGLPGTTGTRDVLPLEPQVKMIRALMPEARTLGVIYCSNQAISKVHLERLKEICPQYGFKLETAVIDTQQDVPQVVDQLLPKVDAINMIFDHVVVTQMEVIVDKAEQAGKPVFGSEVEQVKRGCTAAMDLDFYAMGIECGKMAAEILNGKNPDEMPIDEYTDSFMVYDPAKIDQFSLKLTDDLDAVPIDEI